MSVLLLRRPTKNVDNRMGVSKMSEYAQSQGISVTNTCYDCALVSEYSPEYRCLTCIEDKEGIDDAIAYELVDEGNMQYGKTMWSRTDDNPQWT